MKARMAIDLDPKLRTRLSKRMLKILSAVSRLFREANSGNTPQIGMEGLAAELGISQDSTWLRTGALAKLAGVSRVMIERWATVAWL